MGTRAELIKLVALTASGTLRPLVGATFPLQRDREAVEQLRGGGAAEGIGGGLLRVRPPFLSSFSLGG